MAVIGKSGKDWMRTYPDALMRKDMDDWSRAGATDAEVHRRLQDKYGHTDAKSVRTVGSYLADMALAAGDPYRFGGSDDDKVVLAALALTVRQTNGAETSIQNGVAKALIWIRKMAPDLPLISAVRTARWYAHRVENGYTTEDMDMFFAFAPWRSEQHLAIYNDMCNKLLIPATVWPWPLEELGEEWPE